MRIRVKVMTDEETPVPSITDVFPAAGKILLQCEGFELFVRTFELRPLKK